MNTNYNTISRNDLIDALSHETTENIIDLHNRMCDDQNYYDNHVYSMDEFDDLFCDTPAWEVARACFYSSRFCPVDHWFYINAYGNNRSFDYYEDSDIIFLNDIADWLLESEPEEAEALVTAACA